MNTEIIMRENVGLHHFSLKTKAGRFGVMEGAFLLGFLIAFMGMIFLLAR